MKKIINKIILLGVFLSYHFSFGQNLILYDQTQNTDAPDLPSQEFETANNNYNCQGADDFVIPNDTFWTIDSIFIAGGYSLFGGPCDSVKFYVFQNSGGVPAATLYSVTKYNPDPNGSGNFVVKFSPSLVLPDGHYWLCVQAIMNYSTVGGWYWTTQTAQSNYSAKWKNPGGGFNTSCSSWSSASTCSNVSPDLSFRVYGRAYYKYYCIPIMNPGVTDGDFIDGVSLGNINNMSTGSINGSFYNDYTSLSTTLNIGSTYQLVIKGGAFAPDYYTAWIDYNVNYNLNDPGEQLGTFQTASSYQTQIITFTVPSNAVLGSTRLRVRCVYSSSIANDPCSNGSYGETEDYTIVIAPALGLPPVADFVANATNITVGGSVNFTDMSFNAPTSWQWQFPGGSPAFSTVQNPLNITYSTPGTYNVTLVATNQFGSDTMIKSGYITAQGGSAPTTDFVASAVSIVVGDTIDFFDLSANNPTSWQWVFTNGIPASASSQNPTGITYTIAGCHQVTLIAANSFGSDAEIKTCYIDVTLTSVEEENADNIFIVTPNPATDYIYLETQNNILFNNLNIELFNMLGESVLFQGIPYLGGNGRTSIDMTSLTKGVYLLKIQNGERNFVKRIVKM